MIKLLFERSGQYFFIMIDNKQIFYTDKKQGAIWGGPLRYLPPDPEAQRKIDMSRNKIPAYFKEFLIVSKEEMIEFEKAENDNDLKEIVLRDTRRHECKLIKEEK